MKILVVDDESFVLESFGRFIGKQGHIALLAENGTKAVELYKEQKPELVFLDIVLPDIKGDVVFKKIKEFDKDANVYFITGCHDEYVNAKELKASGIFFKPIELEDIKKVIDDTDKRIKETK